MPSDSTQAQVVNSWYNPDVTIRLRTIFLGILAVLLLWFLYLERAILTPFLLGAIFAYLFNPVVNFLTKRIYLPRILSTALVYLILVGGIGLLAVSFGKRIISESTEFSGYIRDFSITAEHEINSLPDWFRPTIEDTLSAIQESNIFSGSSLLVLFPEAIYRVASVVIFLFSGFYFLKQGPEMIDKLLQLAPSSYRIELEILFRKINSVLSEYLRGQLFLVFLVSSILFIGLTILGVKFALLLAIFSGLAEIVPFIGPLIATAVAAFITWIGGTSNFSFTPLTGILVVVAFYFVLRQFQDYFITPYVMGKITKLHPLIILFSVLAGEHLMGTLGLILAVPVAAIVRVLIEFSHDRILEEEKRSRSTKKS